MSVVFQKIQMFVQKEGTSLSLPASLLHPPSSTSLLPPLSSLLRPLGIDELRLALSLHRRVFFARMRRTYAFPHPVYNTRTLL